MLLTADWHLTDAPADEYRWRVFDVIRENLPRTRDVFILGDLTDRKDRHSAALVNRLCQNFRVLSDMGFRINIIMGNHDAPMIGDPYWSFLSMLNANVKFHATPRVEDNGLLLLPFTQDPRSEWATLKLSTFKALFMHQPASGAIRENATSREFDDRLPIFPRGLKIYSGDAHVPQNVGRIVYVGAPHPIKFGDQYKCRMLHVSPRSFAIIDEIELNPPQKRVIEVEQIEDLDSLTFNEGDQVRLRVKCADETLSDWGRIKDELQQWATAKSVYLVSSEVIVSGNERGMKAEGDFLSDPLDILATFCWSEKIGPSMAAYGKELLDETISEQN